jgi:hypothetical protein
LRVEPKADRALAAGQRDEHEARSVVVHQPVEAQRERDARSAHDLVRPRRLPDQRHRRSRGRRALRPPHQLAPTRPARRRREGGGMGRKRPDECHRCECLHRSSTFPGSAARTIMVGTCGSTSAERAPPTEPLETLETAESMADDTAPQRPRAAHRPGADWAATPRPPVPDPRKDG